MAKSEKKKAPPRPRKPKADKPVKVAKLLKADKPVKVGKPAKAKKTRVLVPPPHTSDIDVLDRLYALVETRRTADPEVSHSARLLSRGVAKVAQKFGEEAVECLIEAVAGNHDALVAESADVLYHLIVLWVSAGITADEVWTELVRREGISGIAEKAARPRPVFGTSKIP